MRQSMARALGVLGLFVPVICSADVFINEFHYNSPGSPDAGEFIEVVATGGEDLSQYRIVLYNGSNGLFYDDDALGAGATLACNAGIRAAILNYAGEPPSQIQNGNPDGIALVGPGSAVVQFLSYGGSFAAGDGPAAGMTSTDIGVQETGSTPADHSLYLTGSGTSYAEFTWDGPATATPGDCNTGQSFGAPVDNPPEVAATVPAQGGTLPANHGFTITFSEPVDTAGGWFTLICGDDIRQASAFDVAGGPVSFTLDPHDDLIEGRDCLLAIHPLAVTDRDGTPDTMAAPFDLAFTVTAPVANAPPVVLSTTPMDGADSFPPFGDLAVVFSEPVTLAPGAFTLACLASTGIVLDHASSGTSFAIGTGTALIGDDPCTFTVHASLVQDSEGASPLADTVVHFLVASSSATGYYDQVNTSSPEQLRCSLHETIKGHTVLPYGWEPLEDAEEAPAGACPSSNYILDIYRNRCYQKVTARSNPVGPNNYNREHVWPRSLGFNGNSLAAHNDMHMLHLSASDYNGNRGNMPFANCTSGCTRLGTDANNGDGGSAARGDANWFKGPDGNQGSFEVWDRWKGNMARAIFYMAIRYEGVASEDAHDGNIPDLELTDNRSLIQITSNTASRAYMGLLTDLLEWHAADPVDARELARNEVVFGYQGNRNPFVDHPEWATRALFESSQPTTCVLGTPNAAPVAVDDAYDGFEDTLLVVAAAQGVLANDSDADNDPLGAQLVADASHGTLQLAGDGGFEYQPEAGFCGTDQFTYRASDGQALSAVAIASIEVECAADPQPEIFANGFED